MESRKNILTFNFVICMINNYRHFERPHFFLLKLSFIIQKYLEGVLWYYIFCLKGL